MAMEHTYSKKKKGKVQTGKQTSTAVTSIRVKYNVAAYQQAGIVAEEEELTAASINAYVITYCSLSIDWQPGQQLAACEQGCQCMVALGKMA